MPRPARPLHPRTEDSPRDGHACALSALVDQPDYPCLGARSVFRRGRVTLLVLDELADPAGSDRLAQGLRQFAESVGPQDELASFVTEFRGPALHDERHFEELLWRQLQQLHDRDDRGWNHKVSNDPENRHFAFSLGGTAFFVVGLHPGASRIARRASVPTLVFNLHEQFERLRASERFTRMRDRIRERDRRLQGTLNPMVADHGDTSEARQYSGRLVGIDWHAPFHPHDPSA